MDRRPSSSSPPFPGPAPRSRAAAIPRTRSSASCRTRTSCPASRVEAERLPAVRVWLRPDVRVMDGGRRRRAQRPGGSRSDPRGEEARRHRRASGQPRRAVRARSGGDPGDVSPGSHHAAAEAQRRSRRRQVRSDLLGRRDRGAGVARSTRSRWRGNQKSLAFLTRRRRGHRAALVDRFLAAFRRARRRHLRAVRRRCAAARQRAQLRTRAAADLRSRERALRPQLRRRLPRHLEFAGVAGRTATARCGRGGLASAASFVQVESRMSQTGANADEWVPVRPGTEGVLALGLAHVIMAAKLRPAGAGGRAGALIDGWSAGLTDYAPEQVEKITGVAAASRRAPGARVRRDDVRRWRSSAARRSRTPTACSARWPSTRSTRSSGSVEQPGGVFFTPQIDIWRPPQRIGWPRSRAGVARQGRRRASSMVRRCRRCCCSTARIPFHSARRRGRCARRSRRFRSSSASAASSTRRASWRT